MIPTLIRYYSRYGVFLLVLLWTVGTVFLGVLHSLGFISSKTHLLQFGIAWIALVLFILWDKRNQSKQETDIFSDDAETQMLKGIPVLSPQIFILGNILFVLGIIVLLLTLQFTESRPTIWFILHSILSGLLTALLLLSPKQITTTSHLIRIGVFSALTTFSFFKTYFWLGNDTWAHASWNELTAEIGNIYVTLGKEADYPLYHIAVTIAQIVPDVDVRLASLLVVAVPSLLLSITLYLLLRKVVGERFALVACLIINICGYLIDWRVSSMTTSYGVTLLFVLYFLYFTIIDPLKENEKKRYLGLYVIFLVVLCLSHQFSTFMCLLVLLGFYIGSIIYHKSLKTPEIILLAGTFLIMLLVWITASFGFNRMVYLISQQISVTSGTIAIPVEIERYVNMTPPDTLSQLLSNPLVFLYICMLCLLYISLKYMYSPKSKTKYLHQITYGYGLIFIGFCITTIVASTMQGRFLPVLTIFLTISFVYVAYYILNKSKSYSHAKICIGICILVSVFCIMSVPTASTAADSTWMGEIRSNPAISTGDLLGMITIAQYLPENHAPVHLESATVVRLSTYANYMEQYGRKHVIPEQEAIGTIMGNWFNLENYSGNYVIYREDIRFTATMQLVNYAPAKFVSQTIFIGCQYVDNISWENNMVYTNKHISNIIVL